MIAGGVLLVVIVLMVVLIGGCESNRAKNSLKNYAANVNSLVRASDHNGKAMFRDLERGELNSDQIANLQSQLLTAVGNARLNLTTAQRLSAPGAVTSAQANLLTMMQMRLDGISEIANHIQDAASTDTSKDAVYDISVGTSLLYASDVLYKTFVTTGIARALNGSGIPIGGTTGVPINAGQIVPDLGWLQSTFIGEKIGARLPPNVANTAGPGVHGHQLNAVSVGGTNLSTVATNTVASSPAPTFTLNLTNGGTTNEYDVECEVKVSGLTDTGTSTIAETTPGQTTTCTVQLPSPPTPGTYPVTVEVVPVPGEKNKKNNSITFPITFS